MSDFASKHLNHHWASFLSYRSRRLTGIQTGIPALDRVLLGLSGITVLQGSPGSFKSSLALQIAGYQASLGNPALIIDRENGRERFRMRLLCQANAVSQVDVLTCEKARLKELVATVRDWPLYVETEPMRAYDQIGESLKEMERLHPGKPMLLVVDSLQAMPIIANEERISLQNWMGALDQAKLDWEGRLTTIVTSEKRRGAGGEEYERANLSSGKGSSSVEYKGEIVLDLRRNKQSGNIIVEVMKHRDGAANVAVELQLVLSDPSNSQSCTFRLEAA